MEFIPAKKSPQFGMHPSGGQIAPCYVGAVLGQSINDTLIAVLLSKQDQETGCSNQLGSLEDSYR